MKRSIGMFMAVALLALTGTVDSAKAQGYRRYGNGGGGGGGSSIAGAILGGIVAGAIIGAILSNADRGAMTEAYPRVFEDDIDDGYRADFEGDGCKHQAHRAPAAVCDACGI